MNAWDAEKTISKSRKATIGLNVCSEAVGFMILLDAPSTRMFAIYMENWRGNNISINFFVYYTFCKLHILLFFKVGLTRSGWTV